MARRDVRGQWTIEQRNGFRVPVNIHEQKPDVSIAGTASHSDGHVLGSGFGDVREHPAEFRFRIGWNNQTEGAYNVVFNAEGFIDGSTFDVKNPQNVAGWKSSRGFPFEQQA